MAEVVVEVDVETGEAVKNVEKLTKEIAELKAQLSGRFQGSDTFDEMNKELVEAEKNLADLSGTIEDVPVEESQKRFKNLGKAITDSTKNGVAAVGELGGSVKGLDTPTKGASKGFKGLGLAMKATGIGLIVALVAGLTEAFKRNKKVMDAVTLVFDTIAQIFSQITDALVATYEQITANTEQFDALKKVVLGVITIALTPLKVQLLGLKTVALGLKVVWEELFGDDESIQQAKDDLFDVKEQLVQIGEDAIQAGKNIGQNIGEAAEEIGGIAEIAVENLSEVSISAARAQAEANKAAEDGAIIAAAQAERVVAQYERQAEQLRQLRDDESSSIADRTKANEELALVLDEQEKALLRQADAVIAGANAEFQKNDSIENRAAIITAIAGKEQVLADIEGQRSEQLVNRIALEKEAQEIENVGAEGEAARAIRRRENAANEIQDDALRNQAKLDNLEIDRQVELERLQIQIDAAEEGTLIKAEADQAYLDAELEFNEKEVELKKARDAAIQVAADEAIAAELAAEQAAAEAKNSIQNSNIDNVVAGIGVLKSIAGENKKAQAALLIAENAAGIAKTIINTVAANAKAVSASPLTLGQPWVGINTASAGIGIASSISATAKGLSALGGGGSSGGGGGGVGSLSSGGGGGSEPNFAGINFDFLGEGGESSASDFQSLDEETTGRSTVRAYVTESEITDEQAASQKVDELASLHGG